MGNDREKWREGKNEGERTKREADRRIIRFKSRNLAKREICEQGVRELDIFVPSNNSAK